MATDSAAGLETLLGGLGLKTPIPSFGPANVMSKPMDIGRSYLADILLSLVEEDPATVYNSIQSSNDTMVGDFYVPVPKISHVEDPVTAAFQLMQKFPPNNPLFVLPVPDGVLLRIFFNSILPRILVPYIKDRGSDYGKVATVGLRDPGTPESGRLKVVVEFSSPNIVTEFEARHLRSTLLGAYIANLYESMGWDVVRINYLGDWGQHIGLFGAGWSKFGREESMNDHRHLSEVHAKVNELFQVELAESKKAKSKTHGNGQGAAPHESKGLFAEREEFFKRLEDGNEEAIKLWTQARDASINHYTRLYERLNVKFDEYSGESQVTPESIAEIEGLLEKKALSEERDGSLIIDFDKHDIRASPGILRRNGSSSYLLRDLGAILDRYKKYNFDKMIYVVSSDQETHFRKVKKTIQLLDEEYPGLSEKLCPVHFSKVSKMTEMFQSGHLEDILDQAQKSMKEALVENQDEAAILASSDDATASMGILALLAQEMSARRSSDHSFDMAKMTSFEPGTGPYMQYIYSKVNAVLAESPDEVDCLDLASLTLESRKTSPCPYTELLRLLIQYPDTTVAAYESMEAYPVMMYLQVVTKQVVVCLDASEEEEGGKISPSQKAVFEAARQVLQNGMKLLGMKPSR